MSSFSVEPPAGAIAAFPQLALPVPVADGLQDNLVTSGLAWLLARYHRAEVQGLSDLPRGRPLIYVAKHPRSALHGETLLLAAAVAQAGLVPIRHLDPGPGVARAVPSPSVWPRPLERSTSQRAALSALRAGESLLVYPGGARELHGPPDALQWRSRRGYARLAVLSCTPVVPVVIEGADQQHALRLRLEGGRQLFVPPLPLPVKLTFRFGEPMPPPARGDPLALTAFSEEVAHATRLLLARGRERRKRRR